MLGVWYWYAPASMGSRMAILAGLLLGVIVGAGGLAAYVAYGPGVAAAPSLATVPPSIAASPSQVAASPPAASARPSATSTPVPTPAAATTTHAFHIGERAPSFQLRKVGGGQIDLATLKGKPVWIVFIATWCPSCADELPIMNGFAARYAENGLVVVAIDVGEPEERVDAFAEAYSVVFPVALDPDGAAAHRWGVVVPPIHFWIDKEGVIRDGALGGIGPDIMVAALQKVMPGTDVTP